MNPTTLSQSAAVHYTVSIHEADGRLVRRLPRKRNLILDQGLDGIAVRTWVESFTYAALGTDGATPTKRDSGTVTVSRAGSNLTSSAGFFVAADVGRLFKFDSGEEVRISAYTDASHVTTSTSGTIAAAEGTVWYVNQTALITEVKRTNNCSTDGGANGSSLSGAVWTHTRTFVFPAEVGTVTYREIGWSHTGSGGANLFGRDLLAGAGVTLVAGQQLRVVVALSVAYSPASATAYTSIATGGWTQNGTCGIEGADAGGNIPYVDVAGGSVVGTVSLEPCAGASIYVSTATTAIRSVPTNSAMNIGGVVDTVAATLGTYGAGSFTRNKTATFSVAQGNSAAIRSLAIGRSATSCAFRVLLAAAETKTSSQTLTLGFTYSWGRILSNA